MARNQKIALAGWGIELIAISADTFLNDARTERIWSQHGSYTLISSENRQKIDTNPLKAQSDLRGVVEGLLSIGGC